MRKSLSNAEVEGRRKSLVELGEPNEIKPDCAQNKMQWNRYFNELLKLDEKDVDNFYLVD